MNGLSLSSDGGSWRRIRWQARTQTRLSPDSEGWPDPKAGHAPRNDLMAGDFQPVG